MTIKPIMLGLSALALTANFVPAADAGTATGTLQIKARISAACALKTASPTLDFGTLTGTPTQTFAQTNIVVQCSKGQAYQIGFGLGLHPSGTNWRNMQSGSNTLAYQLYQDANHLIAWGDKAYSGVFKPYSATGDGSDQKYPVYGGVLGQETPPVGDYADTVAITVTY